MGFLIIPALVGLGIVFYLFSVSSRKSYRCPQCGERITNVEHMEAKRCGMCGAPTCGSFAEDVVLGRVTESVCVHLNGNEGEAT